MSIMILKIGKAVLSGIYAIMKLRPVRKKATILSRQSDEPTEDIALLACYLGENHPDLELKVMCRKLEDGSAFSYGIHMLSQMWNMANSRVILLDSYCIAASILKHRSKTEVVQMWHSMAAIKQFGYQNLDRPGGRSRRIAETMCMHRNYDHVLCPSKKTGEFFCRAFDVDRSKLLLMALPRVDRIMEGSEAGKDLGMEYGIDPDKELILYAPTFRKNRQLEIDDLIECLDPDRFALVICPHPLDKSSCLDREKVSSKGCIVIDRKHETVEWLAAADRVITDYSAIAVEAALADKPLYFYVYDIEEYLRDEGLNMDPREEYPEITATDAGALAGLIEGEYHRDQLDSFRSDHFEADASGCTARLGEYIYGLA